MASIQSLNEPLVDVAGEPFIDDSEVEKGRTSVPGAVFNFVCTCIGAGMLSLPGALDYAGWIGLLLIVCVALFSNTTAKLLIQCLHIVPDRRLRTYEEIGEECFGIWGYRMVALCQNTTLFGVCTIFLILIGLNMNTLVDSVTLHTWIFIFGVCLIPVSWLKTMSEISYLAIFGLSASLIVGTIVIVNGFTQDGDLVPHEGTDTQISLGLNIIVFSFGFHSILPAVEGEMQDPSQFPKVANISCTIIGIFYFLVSAAGYAGYGTTVEDNVLQSMDSDSPVVKLALAMITAHVVLAYPLPLNPVSLAVERAFGIDKLEGKKELTSRITVRTLLVLATIFIASVVPYFGDVLSLVSAFSLMAVAFIFPTLFYFTLTRKYSIPVSPLLKAWMLLIFLVGIVGLVLGLYYALKQLADDISAGGNPFDGFFK